MDEDFYSKEEKGQTPPTVTVEYVNASSVRVLSRRCSLTPLWCVS